MVAVGKGTDVETGLRRLRYFSVLAKTLNFRRAAAELNITQPALSRAISHLEKDVGVRLLERSNTKVSLTAPGETFCAECDRILGALGRAIEETRRVARGEVGTITVGYTDTAIAGAMPDIIESFRRQEPRVTVHLMQASTATQLQMIRSGVLDIGLMTGPVDRAVFCAIPVQADRLVALVPRTHGLAARDSVRLHDLAAEPFVLGDPEEWSVYNRHLLRICETAGFAPRVVQTAPEVRAIIGLVSCGLGLSIMPESHSVGLDSRAVALPIQDVGDMMVTEAAWLDGLQHPAQVRFVAHLRDHSAALP